MTISNECAEADLQAQLLFEDRGHWETVLKLRAQIGSTDPGDRMYADALGGLLAHELLRLDVQPRPRGAPIAAFQRVGHATHRSKAGSRSWSQHGSDLLMSGQRGTAR